jgi:hypothetical protein
MPTSPLQSVNAQQMHNFWSHLVAHAFDGLLILTVVSGGRQMQYFSCHHAA